jgi:uncharacterized membrane protein YhaH (DUF805 family)
MEEMFAPFVRYGDFSGRSRRTEYWLYTILHFVVSALLLMGFFTQLIANRGFSGLDNSALNFFTAFIFWWLLTFIPSLAVTIRRLHDVNFSGWFIFIQIVPFGSLVLLIMLLMNGTKGPNSYGPDPRGGNEAYYWWENGDGPPEGGYPKTARVTGGDTHSAPAAPSYQGRSAPVGYPSTPQFGRRSATPGYHSGETSDTARASQSREAWLRRLEGQ